MELLMRGKGRAGERQTHPLEGHILSLTTFHGIKNTITSAGSHMEGKEM